MRLKDKVMLVTGGGQVSDKLPCCGLLERGLVVHFVNTYQVISALSGDETTVVRRIF
jgi:hypothetical protein